MNLFIYSRIWLVMNHFEYSRIWAKCLLPCRSLNYDVNIKCVNESFSLSLLLSYSPTHTYTCTHTHTHTAVDIIVFHRVSAIDGIVTNDPSTCLPWLMGVYLSSVLPFTYRLQAVRIKCLRKNWDLHYWPHIEINISLCVCSQRWTLFFLPSFPNVMLPGFKLWQCITFNEFTTWFVCASAGLQSNLWKRQLEDLKPDIFQNPRDEVLALKHRAVRAKESKSAAVTRHIWSRAQRGGGLALEGRGWGGDGPVEDPKPANARRHMCPIIYGDKASAAGKMEVLNRWL